MLIPSMNVDKKLLETEFLIAICRQPFVTRLYRWQSKLLKLSVNVDQKSLETIFSIAICRQRGDKWQLKTLFLTIFDLRLIVLAFSIAAYPM